MNDMITKAVAAMGAAVGGWLAYVGVVDAETWAITFTPAFAAALAGVVGVVVYGAVKRFWDAVAGMWLK